jgi:hypothetical protein
MPEFFTNNIQRKLKFRTDNTSDPCRNVYKDDFIFDGEIDQVD